MTSIQDIADAAHRIGDNAKEVQTRTLICAESLKSHATRLRSVVRGSRTGEDAVQQVDVAEREVRQCAAKLLTLQSDIDRFIQDLTK